MIGQLLFRQRSRLYFGKTLDDPVLHKQTLFLECPQRVITDTARRPFFGIKHLDVGALIVIEQLLQPSVPPAPLGNLVSGQAQIREQIVFVWHE